MAELDTSIAWGSTSHIRWCKACGLALLPIRNVFALMVVPKHAITTHAHFHANRWTRIVAKLLKRMMFVLIDIVEQGTLFHA